jgi:hypothetical protein
MNSNDFVYWLQGFLELKELENPNGAIVLSKEQIACIREHMGLVKVTNISAPIVVRHPLELTC